MERIVKVALVAQINNYLANIEQAKRKTQEFGKAVAAEATKNRAEFEEIGRGVTAFGALAAVGVGLAIAKFAEFDAAMSEVQAATHESASTMELLRDAALDAGATTVFSATEAANAIEELSKAGVSTADILNGGLAGALDLAAAGGLGVADAAGIAATALTQFKLEGEYIPHVADLLAAGAGKAMGSVEDLSAALNQGGLVASSTGLTIEETTGTLSAFAAAGLLGSDAGTSFKTMLQRLTPQSAEARAKMEELGISAYDAQGNFVGMEKFAGILQTGLSDLTVEQRNAALSVMFGSDAVRAATVIYEQGADGIGSWIDAVDDQGYAAETAAIRLDNLKGDVEALGGAFDTALITTGAHADESLRALVQTATAAVDVYNAMPDALKGGVLQLGLLATGAGLAGGTFFLATPKIVAFRVAMTTLREEAPKTMRAVSLASKALGAIAAVTVALSVLQAASDAMKDTGASAEELRNALETSGNAGLTFRKAFEGLDSMGYGTVDRYAENWGAAIEKISKAPDMRWLPPVIYDMFALDQVADESRNRLAALGDELAGLDSTTAQEAFRGLVEEAGGTERAQKQLLELMPAYKNALIDQATELGLAADEQTLLNLAMGDGESSADAAATAYLEAADEVSSLSDKILDLVDAMNVASGINQDAVTQNAAYQEALAGISDEIDRQRDAYEDAHGSLDGFTFSLDQSTAAGSANAAMLVDVASSAQSAAEAQYQVDLQTMSAEDATSKYVDTLAASKQALIDQAIQNGATAEEVQALADKIFQMPTQKEIDILVDTASARNSISSLIRDFEGRTIRVNVAASGNPVYTKNGAPVGYEKDGGVLKYYRNGGTENHVAQMAPAGAWRVWAEDETGGESYIPHAPSKRTRSLAIWRETGKILGVRGFAEGAVLGGYTPGFSPSITVAAPPVSLKFDSPIVANGNVVGWVRGIAGEAVRFELAQQASDLSAGFSGV